MTTVLQIPPPRVWSVVLLALLPACGFGTVSVVAGASTGGGAPDTTNPETEIVAAPAALSNNPNPEFRFSSNEPGVQFEVTLDDAPPVMVGSSHVLQGLGELPSPHTVSVVAVDRSGNRDATPSTHSWIIDLTPPPGVTQLVGKAWPNDKMALRWQYLNTQPKNRVYHRVINSPTWTSVLHVPMPGDAHIVLDGLPPCQDLELAVTAMDDAGNESPFESAPRLVVRSHGCGGFGEPLTMETPLSSIRAMQLVDLNGDSMLDIVLAGSMGSSAQGLVVALGQLAPPYFGAFATPAVGAVVTPLAMCVGNVIGGSSIDIVVVGLDSADSGAVDVYEGSGAGGLQLSPTPRQVISPRDARIADTNQDGFSDLVVLCAQSIVQFLGTGSGISPTAAAGTGGSLSSGYTAVSMEVTSSLFTNDGDPDLLYCASYTGPSPLGPVHRVRYKAGNSGASWSPEQLLMQRGPSSTSATPDCGLFVVDIDGDGRRDVIEFGTVGYPGTLGAATTSGIGAALQLVAGAFQDGFAREAQREGTFGEIDEFGSLSVGDFDGDGNLDIVCETRFGLSYGVGAGGFADQALSLPNSGISSPFGLWQGPRGLTVLFGSGTGGFPQADYYAAGGSGRGPASRRLIRVADLDASGRPDVCLAAYSGSDVKIFMNNHTVR